MQTFTNPAEVRDYILKVSAGTEPFIVAVDGFAGSGKSTLCRKLTELLPDCGTVQIDDFIIYPHAPNVFDHHWKAIEDKVLKRLKTSKEVVTKTYDWNTLSSVTEHVHAVQRYMLIDGIGLLDPKNVAYYDLKIWVDCPFEVSMERGKRRDKYEQGVDHDELWDNVWGPGEKRYFDRVRPDVSADVQYKTY